MKRSLAILLALAPSFLLANGFNNPPGSAAAFGRHGGNFAFSDDVASAIYFNPANLEAFKGLQSEASFTFLITPAEYTRPDGVSEDLDEEFSVLPNVYFSYGEEEGNIVYGFGITTPFGNRTEWKEDGVFAGLFPHEAELFVLNFNPTASMNLGNGLSVGVGADLYYSELSFEQVVPWGVLLGAPGLPNGSADVEGDGTGLGGNLGLVYEINERHRASFHYRSSVEVDYEGDGKFSNVPPPVSAMGLPNKTDFDSEIEFPSKVGLGYSTLVTDQLRVGVDLEWIEFSTYDSLPVDLGPASALGLFPPEIPQNWDDVWNFYVGADYRVSELVTLRAGYAFLESPVPEETYSPTLLDADKHFLSVGVGYRKDNLHLDLSFAYSIADEVEIRNNQNPAALGEYDINGGAFFGLSSGIKF